METQLFTHAGSEQIDACFNVYYDPVLTRKVGNCQPGKYYAAAVIDWCRGNLTIYEYWFGYGDSRNVIAGYTELLLDVA